MSMDLKVFITTGEPTCEEITGHACQKYSGRVGRSVAAKAHLRHVETEYDSLLARGVERFGVSGK